MADSFQLPPCSRRRFLIASAAAAAGFALGDLTGCADLNVVGVPDSGDVVLNLDDPKYASLKTAGTAVKARWKNGAPIIVRSTAAGEYEAYSASCTHAGCEVPLPTANGIKCPCHGARYDADGKRLSGPGHGDLRKGTTTLAGSDLTISF